MEHYMDLKNPTNHGDVDHIYSLVHLKRGIFMSSGNDKKLKVWVPGHSEPNYLGCLEEDHIASNLSVLEGNKKDIKVVYTCDRYIKVLSFEKGQSMIVFRNMTDITSLCVVDQQKTIVSFGMHSGAVKDFDMKNKQIVLEAKAGGAHKSAICCLTSFGKWLVSVSSDNIVIYDYQAMKEHSNFSISGDTD